MLRGIIIPYKCILPQETRERGGDDVEVLDELPVVAREAQEAMKIACRLWQGLCSHGGNLVGIHGDIAL
jgi:hypothetical protein